MICFPLRTKNPLPSSCLRAKETLGRDAPTSAEAPLFFLPLDGWHTPIALSPPMPGGGKINIEACATENGVLIEITDTGTGIPLDVDAFEPFVTTKKEGTGIGLVIVCQIVTAHGGDISYRSRPGEGTTFRIELSQK
jgi:hypothetical protein